MYFMVLKILPMIHFNYLLLFCKDILKYTLDASPFLDNYFLNVVSDSVSCLLKFTIVLLAAKVSHVHKVAAVRFSCFLFTSLCSFTGVESGSYM